MRALVWSPGDRVLRLFSVRDAGTPSGTQQRLKPTCHRRRRPPLKK